MLIRVERGYKMKVFMINPNNERFEAEIVRYFQNINDKYIIYTLGEKDANGFQIVYATKIVNDGGIRVGKTITDENEWVLVKNFIKETVNQNKNNQPLTIQDANPAEILELKIDSTRPFKLQAVVVDMFAKNQKSFEIVQNIPKVESTKVETVIEPVVNAPIFEPQPETVVEVQPTPQPETPIFDQPATVEPPKVESPIDKPTPVEVAPVEITDVEPPAKLEETPLNVSNTDDYKELYEQEVAKNKDLANQLETLMHDYVTLKVKMDQIKELLG